MSREEMRSPRLPGGDIFAALFDRDVMTFADRGGASNLIGDRWADLAAAHAAGWSGGLGWIELADGETAPIDHVDRLDATPRIAAEASRHGLQNPDLLLIGGDEYGQVIQAADAKFSIETARSKQVSPEVVLALLGLRDRLPELLPNLEDSAHVEPGIFLAPDYPLTHMVLRGDRRGLRGIVRPTVAPHEVVLVPTDPAHFWDGVPGASVIAPLAELDDLPVSPAQSLLAGVYYFRLARAAVGFWLDATKPLLLFNDRIELDEAAVRAEAERRARHADSAIALIWQWDTDVQTVRNQRASIEHVAGLPIPGRELRPRAATIAESLGAESPSANQVRRRLSAWYRAELRSRIGPVNPPVPNLPDVLRQIAQIGKELTPQADRELERVVRELIAEMQGVSPISTGAVINAE
ncbi:MAG: hypothetical protein M3Z20_08020 [Chloroflexota bacterium]|nr:hypothetical protein [Chloroflexota bacterium]